MALIDPDGLFNGDRFELISDQARLMWPHFWCASNTVGRIELNYHKVMGRAFSRFKKPPTEEDFWGLVKEYNAAWLLFVYEADGTLWGQWDTSAKYLPKYQLTQDKQTPVPDEKAFTAWKNEYIEAKRSKNQRKSIGFNNSTKVSQGTENLQTSFGTDRYGVGIGIGIGEGKNICASGDARLFPDPEPQAPQPAPDAKLGHAYLKSLGWNGKDAIHAFVGKLKTPQLDQIEALPLDRIERSDDLESLWMTRERLRWFRDFWQAYWLRKAKPNALSAYFRQVTTTEMRDKVLAAVKGQRAEMMKREPKHRPHPATWLNAQRWEDETEYTPSAAEPVYRPLMV